MPAYFGPPPRTQAKQVNFGLPYVTDPNPEQIWPAKVFKVGDHVKSEDAIACVLEAIDGGTKIRMLWLNGELKGEETTMISGLFESVSLLEVLAVTVAEADAAAKNRRTCVQVLAEIMESPL